MLQRIKYNRRKMFMNGVKINAACVEPDSTIISSLNYQLDQVNNEIIAVKNAGNALITMTASGLSGSLYPLEYYLNNYPVFMPFKQYYSGAAAYTGSQFVLATSNILKQRSTTLVNQKNDLESQIIAETNNLQQLQIEYQNCLQTAIPYEQAITEQTQAIAEQTEAQTELTQAQTEQIAVETESAIKRGFVLPSWWPYPVVGLAGYVAYKYFNKSKKRR